MSNEMKFQRRRYEKNGQNFFRNNEADNNTPKDSGI